VYELNIKRAAEKDIDQISPSMARRVMDAATKLKREPRPRGTKKLMEDIYRVRVGDYRLIYHIDDEARSVTLLRVKHRREAYR
jgi:mRNA interferase RelE/StbE